MFNPTKLVTLGVFVVFSLFAERSLGILDETKIVIIIQNVTYTVNAEYLKMEVKIRNGSNGASVVDVESDLLKDLDVPLFMSLDLQTKLPEGDEYQTLISSDDVDVCKFILQSTDSTILKMLHENVDKYGNLLKKHCPIVKDHYYLHEFQVDTNILPSFTPAGYYRFIMNLVVKKNEESIVLYDMAWYTKVLKE